MTQRTRFTWKYREGEGRNPPCFWRLVMKDEVEGWEIVYPYSPTLSSPEDEQEHPIGAIQVEGWVVSLTVDEMTAPPGRPMYNHDWMDSTDGLATKALAILDDLFDYIAFIMPQAVS